MTQAADFHPAAPFAVEWLGHRIIDSVVERSFGMTRAAGRVLAAAVTVRPASL